MGRTGEGWITGQVAGDKGWLAGRYFPTHVNAWDTREREVREVRRSEGKVDTGIVRAQRLHTRG